MSEGSCVVNKRGGKERDLGCFLFGTAPRSSPCFTQCRASLCGSAGPAAPGPHKQDGFALKAAAREKKTRPK